MEVMKLDTIRLKELCLSISKVVDKIERLDGGDKALLNDLHIELDELLTLMISEVND